MTTWMRTHSEYNRPIFEIIFWVSHGFGLESRQQNECKDKEKEKMKRSLKVKAELGMEPLPIEIPRLPERNLRGSWSHEVSSAHRVISEAYQAAFRLLRQESGDVLQLRQHIEQITLNIMPILISL